VEGQRMLSFAPLSPSKKVRFNHPALAKVIILKTHENAHVISHSHYLQKTEIKSKILT
jgi:hypothetical protein